MYSPSDEHYVLTIFVFFTQDSDASLFFFILSLCILFSEANSEALSGGLIFKSLSNQKKNKQQVS